MAVCPNVLPNEVLDFPGSNITVAQVLNACVRKAEADDGYCVQVSIAEHGELNIFRAAVQFDTPGCLRLVRKEMVTDDNFLVPFSYVQDEKSISELVGLHGADNTRRILYASARGSGGLFLVTGSVPDDESEHDQRMQEIYAATAHLV